MDTSIVGRLNRVGLSQPTTVGSGRSASEEFLLSDVEAFKTRFVGFKEIARRRLFGRLSTPGASRSYLARRGVKPICGPDINGAPAVFSDHAAVEQVGWFTLGKEQ